MRRFAAALLAGSFALAPRAAETGGDPLEPEQAFPVSATFASSSAAGPGRVELQFAIREGYYLYANRFKVEAPGLSAGPLSVPAGAVKDDPFVGKSRILRTSAVVVLPLASRPPSGEYVLAVTAQGCAENLVCYAPFTQSARLVVP